MPDQCPQRHAGRLEELLWQVMRLDEKVLSVARLRRIVALYRKWLNPCRRLAPLRIRPLAREQMSVGRFWPSASYCFGLLLGLTAGFLR
jgi:hypothetical protein